MTKIMTAFLIFVSVSTSSKAQTIRGGLEAFVSAHTVYPPYSLHNCIQGTVEINFKLNRKGMVYHSEIQKGIGTDLDDEALRLIRMTSGKWIVPAGYDTTLVLKVPVSFSLSGYNCDMKSPQEIARAISAYKANEGLTNAVLNFYRNKEKGIYNAADEPKMLAIKKELGYDDEFLRSMIEDAKAKLKQEDRQGACEDLLFVKHMGSNLADELLKQYCY